MGWPIRKIARQLGISRQSVRKALASSAPPRYKLTKPRQCPVMAPYRPIIETWLAEDQKAPEADVAGTVGANGVAEGLNSKIMTIKRKACGFRNLENFKTAIYFFCGGLDLYPQ